MYTNHKETVAFEPRKALFGLSCAGGAMMRDIGALAAQLDDPRLQEAQEILGSGVAGAVVGIRTPWS